MSWLINGDCDIATAPQLLLVAVESCSWPELQNHVATLIQLGRLARIVVDEAHLLVKQESFRPCMRMLTSFGMLAISIVLTIRSGTEILVVSFSICYKTPILPLPSIMLLYVNTIKMEIVDIKTLCQEIGHGSRQYVMNGFNYQVVLTSNLGYFACEA